HTAEVGCRHTLPICILIANCHCFYVTFSATSFPHRAGGNTVFHRLSGRERGDKRAQFQTRSLRADGGSLSLREITDCQLLRFPPTMFIRHSGTFSLDV